MEISFLPFTPIDYHDQKNLGPLADPRDQGYQTPAYSFYLSDYVIDPLGETPELGVLVHGGRDCAELAQSSFTHGVNVNEPSPADGIDHSKIPGSWLPKLDGFKLSGLDGSICGIKQGFTMIAHHDEDTYGRYSRCVTASCSDTWQIGSMVSAMVLRAIATLLAIRSMMSARRQTARSSRRAG